MQCPRCQHENRPVAKFCEECGVPLARTCSKCGAQGSGTAKFCAACGHPLAEPGAPQPRFSSPDTYTPKHLAERILTSKAALEGERKQVTVLFADLKGSMELLADRDPEEARKLLDPVLERMMDAVHRYEGTVNQVMGDGIMALFGAPVAHEDHAVRACYAALDMQAAIGRYAEEARRSYGIAVEIRVGLNSGEVVVRAIDSDLHMDYTAVGQTTHLAARMEQLATGGRSLLTADTLRLAEGYVEVRPLGPVPVKGLAAPVEIYEMVGAGPRRSRLHAAAARGLTKFVGRETELEQLRQILGRAAAGHGQVVAIVGEPGVGKSRLVWEVTHSHRTHGWLTVTANSVSYGKATPYLPLIDLLKGYFKVQDRDEHREIREKVSGKLVTLDESLMPTLPVFLTLLDVPVEDAQWQRLDPPQRRQRTLVAVKRLLLRESQVQPLLLVFEDLHWIDSETQSLLDSLVESAPTARLLLLVNYRPEYEHRWGSKTYYTQLRLDPLPPEGAEALVGALVGNDPTLAHLKTMLIERTEGNPFFLEESVRTLAEAHVLIGERGRYRLAKPVGTTQLPATVQAVLAARIDRLPLEDKRLLQSAAVIGKDVALALLQAIAEQPAEDLRRSLGRLQAAEFLYETRLFPDLEYTFKHALTHEVAYGGLLQERRRTLHARVVEAIETLHPDRLGEHVERLGHHALRGEVWSKAVRYLRQAGGKAAARSAYRVAASYFEEALATLAHLPNAPETLEQAIDIRLDLRNALQALGEIRLIVETLREAEALAERLGDPRRLAQVAAFMSNILGIMGELDRALEAGDRALTLAVPVGDRPLQVRARFFLGGVCHGAGDYRRAVECYRWIVDALDGDLIYERFGLASLPAVQARAYLALALAELGQFREALRHGEDAVRIAETAEDAFSLIHACHGTGHAHLRSGRIEAAIPALERGLRVAEAAEIPVGRLILGYCLGSAYALGGRSHDAVPLLERVVELERSRGRRGGHARTIASLGEALFLADRGSEAREQAESALKLSREVHERAQEARILWLLGEMQAHRSGPDARAVEAHYREAMAIADELGMRPLVAHCHAGLAKLLRRTGRRTESDEHLAAAAQMYREMGMTYWLEKAGAESGPPQRNSP
jgi:predicted ATPase/class 3 adenylate cyclase